MESPIPEIFDIILSYVGGGCGGKPSLKACVLFSRTWHQLAQRHLFQFITVKCVHAGRTFIAFSQHLNSRNNTIAPHLVNLVLFSNLSGTYSAEWRSNFTVSTLYSILAVLPSLRTLMLKNVDIPPGSDFPPPSRTSIQLEYLGLYLLIFSTQTFLLMLSMFESIDELYLSHVDLKLADADTGTKSSLDPGMLPRPKISSLILGFSISQEIRSLCLDIYFQNPPSGSITSPDRILKVTGAEMVTLKDILNVPRTDWDNLHLTSHDTLISLGLSVICGQGPSQLTPNGPVTSSWTAFFDILAIAPSTLPRLNLKIRFYSDDIESKLGELERCEWGRVERALGRVSALERVSVLVHVGRDPDTLQQIEQLVKAKLRTLDKAGTSVYVHFEIGAIQGMRWQVSKLRCGVSSISVDGL